MAIRTSHEIAKGQRAICRKPNILIVISAPRAIMMVGIKSTAPRNVGAIEMSLKNALGEARRSLSEGLQNWEPPRRQLLPVDPPLAASCLKLALRHRQGELAYAAAATLILFDQDRFWRELLAHAGTHTALSDLGPSLVIMAAARDGKWRRKLGGHSFVGTYFIEQMLARPQTDDPLHLWRLSFAQAENVPPSLSALFADARAIRMGFDRTPERTKETHSGALRVIERLAEDLGDWLVPDASVAVWSYCGAGPALMLPVLAMGCVLPEKTTSPASPASHLQTQNRLLGALDFRSPLGRKALREVIVRTPDLLAQIRKANLTEDQAIEAVSDLLDRDDFLEICQTTSLSIDLCRASRWTGAPLLSEDQARAWGEILRANAPAIDEIRSTHLPTIFDDLALLGRASGEQ